MENNNSPKLILGPIIGKVTSNTARVSIELQFNQEIDCILTSEKDGSKKTCRKVPNRGFPTIFTFSGLDPQTTYTVSLDKLNRDLCSSFRTLRKEGDQAGKLNIAVVSCNEITQARKKTDNQDLWLDLSRRTRTLDYVLHVGDQCYMDMGEGNNKDTPYERCKVILDNLPKEKWESARETVLEILRSHQRLTWSYPSTAAVLANVPSLMILDDHEIRDDWGWRQEDWDANTEKWDYFYGQLARQVYYEYQRQLREDIDWGNLNALKQEYHDHVLNGVGVVFLDYRGSRSWFREEKVVELQLGARQTEWVKGLFGQGGRFDQEKVDSVVFISSLPPVYLSGVVANIAAKIIDDAKEHWTYQNTDELVGLLDILRGWKTRKFGREVTIVGGDVHVGVHTEIYYNKELIFKQLTTSAINNVLTKRHEYFAVKVALAMSGKLNEEYSFKHVELMKRNNYGLVQLENKNGSQLVKTMLVESKEDSVKAEKKATNNMDTKKNTCVCNVF